MLRLESPSCGADIAYLSEDLNDWQCELISERDDVFKEMKSMEALVGSRLEFCNGEEQPNQEL